MESVLEAVASCLGVTQVDDPTPAMAAAVRSCGALPLVDAAAHAASRFHVDLSHPAFGVRVAAAQRRVAALLSRVIEAVEPGAAAAAVAGLVAPERDLTSLSEFLDRLRESAEACVDEARGQHSSQQASAVQSRLNAAAEAAGSSPAAFGGGLRAVSKRPPSAKAMDKPQAAFEDRIDNARGAPWTPRLGNPCFRGPDAPPLAPGVHPYAAALSSLAYPPAQLARATPPGPFAPLDAVECTFVDSPEGLAELMDYLEGTGAAGADCSGGVRRATRDAQSGRAPVTELAVDLEAHSVRSFQGFVCLMQLSTRGRDFLVDAIALRSHLGVFNRVAADPAVLKVLHGCDGDVLWLQRDFGVYLVNVFDTGQGSRVLGLPSFGLAHLLQVHAGVTADKQYQTADWRERPLPAPLLRYAREDTHYLLGVYDRVKNDLIDSSPASSPVRVAGSAAPVDVPNLLAAVLERSRERCEQLYAPDGLGDFRRAMVRLGLKPTPSAQAPAAAVSDEGAGDKRPRDEAAAGADSDGADDSEAAAPAGPLSPRSRAFAGLFEWRDATARAEDESLHYVLPNRLLVRLATERPATIDALSRACHPMPPLVRSRMGDVIHAISTGGAHVAAMAEGAGKGPARLPAPAPATAADGPSVLAYVAPPQALRDLAASAAVAAGLPSLLGGTAAVADAAPPPGGWLSAPLAGEAQAAPAARAAAPTVSLFEGDGSESDDGMGEPAAPASEEDALAAARAVREALEKQSWHGFMGLPLPRPRAVTAADTTTVVAGAAQAAGGPSAALALLQAATGGSAATAPPAAAAATAAPSVSLPVHPDLIAKTLLRGAAAAAAVSSESQQQTPEEVGGGSGSLAGPADAQVGEQQQQQQPPAIRSLAERFPRARPAVEQQQKQQKPEAPVAAAAAAPAAAFEAYDYGSEPADSTGTRAALMAAAAAGSVGTAAGAAPRGGGRGGRGGGRGKPNPYMLGSAAASILGGGRGGGRGGST